jgi:hypothetical protein
MKIYDITTDNTRIIEKQSEYNRGFIHRCGDCSFFETCEKNGKVISKSIACEKFI